MSFDWEGILGTDGYNCVCEHGLDSYGDNEFSIFETYRVSDTQADDFYTDYSYLSKPVLYGEDECFEDTYDED
jgi:hypothetical protein